MNLKPQKNSLRFLIFFWISTFSSFAFAQEMKCHTDETKNKVYMQTVLDHVGFCGLMAFRAQLHQYRCKLDSKNCELPAIVDIVKLSNVGSVMSSEKSYQKFVNDISIGVSLKDETCTPFEGFFKPYPGPLPPWEWKELFTFQILRSIGVELKPEQEDNIRKNWPLIQKQLKIGPSDVFKDVVLKKFQEAINVYSNNPQCKARKIPAFKVQFFPYSQTELINQLKAGNESLLDLRVLQPDGKKTGPHAILVTNHRTTCCSGICLTQFQVIDSLGTYWALQNKGKQWVSEQELTNVIGPGTRIQTLVRPPEVERRAPIVAPTALQVR